MGQDFNCPVCGWRLPWAAQEVGQRRRCQGCDLLLVVPRDVDADVELASDVAEQPELPRYWEAGGPRPPKPAASSPSPPPPAPPVPEEPAPAEPLSLAEIPAPQTSTTAWDDFPEPPPLEPIPLAEEEVPEEEVLELDEADLVDPDSAHAKPTHSGSSAFPMTPLQPLPPAAGGAAPLQSHSHPAPTEPRQEAEAGAYDLAIDAAELAPPPQAALPPPLAPPPPVADAPGPDMIANALERVRKASEARAMDQEQAIAQQRFEDVYLPLGLAGTGLVLMLFTVMVLVVATPDMITGITPSIWLVRGVELLQYFVKLVVQLPFMLFGLVVIARLFGTSFGLIQTALLKICALALLTNALDATIHWVLYHITEGFPGIGFMLQNSVVLGTFWLVGMKLLDMDFMEVFVFGLIVTIVPAVLVVSCFGTFFSMLG